MEGTIVSRYKLYAKNGKPIREATKVIFSDSCTISFMELLPRGKAIEQAEKLHNTKDFVTKRK